LHNSAYPQLLAAEFIIGNGQAPLNYLLCRELNKVQEQLEKIFEAEIPNTSISLTDIATQMISLRNAIKSNEKVYFL
jgi:hypothetical protein